MSQFDPDTNDAPVAVMLMQHIGVLCAIGCPFMLFLGLIQQDQQALITGYCMGFFFWLVQKLLPGEPLP